MTVQELTENSEERSQNRLWQQITDYEQQAKATSNDIKKQHYMKMAQELRYKLKTSDEQGVAEVYRYGKAPWVKVIVRTDYDYDPEQVRKLPLEYRAQGWGNDGQGQLIAFASKKDAAYFILKVGGEVVKTFANSLNDRLGRPDIEEGVAEGLGKDLKRLATGKDVKSRAGQEIAKSQDASMKGDNKTANKHFKRYDKLDKLANKEQGAAEGG